MKKEKKIIRKMKKGGDYTQTVTEPQQVRTNRKVYTLPLRSPQHQLYLYLQKNHSRIHEDTNSYFSEVLNLLYDINSVQSSNTFKKLINIFTEPYVFMKDENELEPLPFSMMEIQIFGYHGLFGELQEESKDEKSEREEIEEEMLQFFKRGYDLELNPYFVRDLSIFSKLQSFIDNKYGGRMSIQNKSKQANVRKSLNTAHNFLKNLPNENNNNEDNSSVSTVSISVPATPVPDSKKRISNLSPLIFKSVNHNLSTKNSLFTLSINSLLRNQHLETGDLTKETLCNSIPPPRTFLQHFNEVDEKRKVKELKAFKIMRGVHTGNRFFTNFKNRSKLKASGNFENKFLRFLIFQNLVDENVFYFSYPQLIGNPQYLINFKELMYNVLGRFQFIVNDANGLSVILSKLLSLKGYKKQNLIKKHGTVLEESMRNNFVTDSTDIKNKVKLYYLLRTSVLQNCKLMVKEEDLLGVGSGRTIRQINLWLTRELKRIRDEMNTFITKIRANMINVNQLNQVNSIISELKIKKKEFRRLWSSILFIQKLQELRQKINYSFNTTEPTNVDYREFTLSSWGMESDPAPGKGYHIQLFSKSLYQKLYLYVFGDLQLNDTKLEFIFDTTIHRNQLQPEPSLTSGIEFTNMNSQKLLNISIKIINENMNQTQLDSFNRQIGVANNGSPIFEFKKDSSDSRPHLILQIPISKDMNKVSLINDVIRELIEKHYGKGIKNKNPSMNINGMMRERNRSNQINVNFDLIEYKNPSDRIYFEVYDRLIRILLKMNYNIYEITRFILRFKILGDQLQGLEAKYNCSLRGMFKCSESDIFVKRRVLVTQDRPLNAYAQIEGDINFLSKATIDGNKLIYWNFGDADSRFDMSHLEESLAFIPLTSMYTMGKSMNINSSVINSNVRTHMQNLNRLENDLKLKKNELKKPLASVSGLTPQKKKPGMINI